MYWWWLFPPVWGFWENVWQFIPRLCFFSFFHKVEINLCTLIPLFRPGSVHSWWIRELRRLWRSVPWRVTCKLVSLISSYTMPGQYIKPTPTSLGQRCMPSLLTCHLHIWQADRGLLRATAVTRGWNGHRIRISTESKLWRTKFFRRPCRESNSQPFDHESGATVQQQAKIKI